MAVESPPSWPPPIDTIEWGLVSNTALFRSPLTGSIQRLSRVGGFWQARVQLAVLTEAQLRIWSSIFADLQDKAGSFYWSPYPNGRPINYPAALGDATVPWASGGLVTDPKVNGASQTGRTLAVDGLSTNAVFAAGDWLAFSNGTFRELHRVTTQASANGAGQATISIVPSIRISPADNAVVYFDGNLHTFPTLCAGEFIFVDGVQANWRASFDYTNSIDFTIREALAA